jgi:multiple sugar transport system permease protein
MLPPVAMIVPLYLVANQLGINDTLLILILPYMALSIPLAVWMLQGFFMDLPKELEEAAFLDGCTRMGAFVRIILPLGAPGIAAVSIFSFTLAWNDLIIALALTNFDATTLPVLGSRLRGEEGIDWGGLGALTTVIMIPALIFTVVMRRHLVGGLSGAAVRG